MKPTPEKIKRQLKKLRVIIDKGPRVESRVAQAMEYAIRWSTIETVGWNSPAKEAKSIADCINAGI